MGRAGPAQVLQLPDGVRESGWASAHVGVQRPAQRLDKGVRLPGGGQGRHQRRGAGHGGAFDQGGHRGRDNPGYGSGPTG